MRTTTTAYGPHPDQFLELTLPAGEAPAPVVVVLHGGFWRAPYGVELARPLAADLAAWATGRARLPDPAPGARPRVPVAGVDLLCVHGTDDDVLPAEQSARAAAVRGRSTLAP